MFCNSSPIYTCIHSHRHYQWSMQSGSSCFNIPITLKHQPDGVFASWPKICGVSCISPCLYSGNHMMWINLYQKKTDFINISRLNGSEAVLLLSPLPGPVPSHSRFNSISKIPNSLKWRSPNQLTLLLHKLWLQARVFDFGRWSVRVCLNVFLCSWRYFLLIHLPLIF